MLDNDDKIDLDLIVALIRHIVLNEDVSLTFQCGFSAAVWKIFFN